MGGLSGLGSAPLHGSLHRQLWSHFILRRLRVVPYGLPGYRRLRRAPPQHHCSPGRSTAPGLRGIWEDSARRKGIPHVRRGVGYVGCWRLARPFRSHRGYLPVGEAFRGRTSRSGLLLGRLGVDFGARSLPALARRRRSGEIQEGKADVTRCETGARRTSSAATRASCPPSSDLVNSSALKHGRLAFTGAR